MDPVQYSQYEYARKRIKQKKYVYYHFILFFVGSIFMLVLNEALKIGEESNWHIWAITVWGFIFILHFIKVFITGTFMDKNWEKEQIEKLVAKQQKRIEKLQSEQQFESSNK